MSPQPSYGVSRDANELDIVKVFEACGWLVARHQIWDLDVCCPGCKQILAIEVKNKTGRGKTTPKQQKLIEDGWPLLIVWNVRDALDLVQRHRQEVHGETRRAIVQ